MINDEIREYLVEYNEFLSGFDHLLRYSNNT